MGMATTTIRRSITTHKNKPNTILSHLLFSTSTTSPPSPPSPCSNPFSLLPPPSPLLHQIQDSTEVASSFKDWFRTSKNPLFDNIFNILRQKGDDGMSSPVKVDVGLSSLGLKLSESFVLEVLSYRRKDVLSCLKFFDWCGRQNGFHHTRATFIAIFKILSSAKLTNMMLDLLGSYVKQRHLHRVRFNDTLVMGYALAGKVDVALKVFGKMRFQGVDLDRVAYQVLLNALVEEEKFDAMRSVLEQVRMRGYENPVTHSIVMKSLCKQGKLLEAEDYLRGLLEGKKKVSGHVLGVLIDTLCKKHVSKIAHAGRLLDEFGEMEKVPMREAYGVWIKNLVQAGRLVGALEFFQMKRSMNGYVPEVFRYNLLINRLLKEQRLEEVCDLLMDMKECGIVPDRVTMNAALCFFCKAGMMEVVIELFNLRSELGLNPKSLVYNYIINTLCGDGNTHDAYDLLTSSMDLGYFPGKRTFSILADALCREGQLEKMKDLVMFALERNFMPADSTYEKFIRALCRARRVDDGYLLHEELSRLNYDSSEVTYTYLIYGFSKVNRGDLSARLLIEMQEKGHKPNRQLFRAVICCLSETGNPEKNFLHFLDMQVSRFGANKFLFNCFIEGAGFAQRPELARHVYDTIERYGFAPNIDTDITMLQCYLKNKRIADALNFFDSISRRRPLSRKLYNCIVVGLCKAQKAQCALAKLEQAKNDRVRCSLECYEELVRLYCTEKKYDDAVALIRDMEKSGRKISTFIGNVLLLNSLYSRHLNKSWADTPGLSDGSTSLGQVIASFSDNGRVDFPVEELENALQSCFPLNVYSYNMMLRRLSKDQIDRACQLFTRLCQKGFTPNRWTYDIIVHGLFKHNRREEARIWRKEMYRQGHLPTESTSFLE